LLGFSGYKAEIRITEEREKQSRGKNEKPLSISIDLCSYIGDKSRFSNPKYESLEIKPQSLEMQDI
jgi:hypothetical protein